MRVLFVIVLAAMILPLTGCAKKKDNPRNTAAASNSSAGGDGGESEFPGDDEMEDEDDAEMEDDAEAEDDAEMEEAEVESDAGEDAPDGGDEEAEYETAEAPAEFPGESEGGGAPAEGAPKKGLPGFAKKVFNFFTPNKPAAAPGDGGEAETAEAETDEAGEAPGDADGETGESTKAIEKPTDIPGVEEGTPEYAAVALILKVSRGEGEGLAELIDDKAKGLLANLRADDNEKALAEAKELFGRVKKNSSRLEGRDTTIYYQNDKGHIVKFFIREVQEGKYAVREIRDLGESPKRAPARRRSR